MAPVVGLGASAGAATKSSLSQYLLKSNEMPGYTVGGRPTTTSTAAAMMEGEDLSRKQTQSDISTLEQAGFVKAVQESPKGSNTNEGLSIVMQFSSPAGAQAGAALFLHIAKTAQAGSKPFTVAGVPGAKGVTVTGGRGRFGQCVLVGGGLRLRLGDLRQHGHVGQGRRLARADRHQVAGQARRRHLPLIERRRGAPLPVSSARIP